MTNPGPVVFPQDNSGSGGAVTPPDYGPAGSATPQPSGTVDVWGLPEGIGKTKIWYDTGTTPGQKISGPGSTGEHSGGGGYNSPAADYQVNMTADQLMQQAAAMSVNDPAGYQALQHLLASANYYNSDSRVYGTWGQTEAALARAVQDYIKVTHNNQGEGAGAPINFRTYLQHVALANAANGNPGNGAGNGSAGTQGPSVVSLADPDTLVRYAQMAAQSALGRALKPEELNKFVNEFHNQQLQAATETVGDKAGAQGSGQGGVVGMVDKNDPRSSAIGFVESNNKDEFAQHQIQGYTDSFLNMFLPNASAAPNVTVDPTAIGF